MAVHLKLRHEHILQLYNVIEDPEKVYLILELCLGGTLNHLIKKANGSPAKQTPLLATPKFRRHNSDSNVVTRRTLFPINENSPSPRIRVAPKATPVTLTNEQIRTVIRQVLTGLNYLHRNGIIHRDLNLNNLLLKEKFDENSTEFCVKICDFGLALDLSQCPTSTPAKDIATNPYMNNMVGNTICGTPGFISPEVWTQTQPASPASDMFGIGSILYALITGVAPKGDLDLSDMQPWPADLISKLLDPNPDNRLSIQQVLAHPFVVGPLNTRRLTPITKAAKKFTLSINEDGSVVVDFGKTKGLIKITHDGNDIVVASAKSSQSYTFDNLPIHHWKKYLYAHRFIDTVKAKTPKIVLHCRSSCRGKMITIRLSGLIGSLYPVSSIDGSGNRKTIVKCTLYENGQFEASVHDKLNDQGDRVLFDASLECNNAVLFAQMKDLRDHCIQLEVDLERMYTRTGFECFPLTIGRRSIPNQSSRPQQQKFNSPDVGYSTMYSNNSNRSNNSSNFLRSLSVQGIGTITQVGSTRD